MARGRSFRQGRVFIPRRTTSWDEGPGSNTLVTYSVSTTTILGAALAVLIGGDTLIRTRGLLTVELQSITSAGDGFGGAVGLGLASTDAVVAGVGSLPNPVDDLDWEGWIWHQFVNVFSAATIEDNWSPGDAQQIQIDSKAMRKADDNLSFFFSGQFTEVGTAEMDVRVDSRMLFKLP